MTRLSLVVLALSIILISCSRNPVELPAQTTSIKGEVFIRTNDASVIPMAAIQVGVYPERIILNHLAARDTVAENIRQKLSLILDEMVKKNTETDEAAYKIVSMLGKLGIQSEGGKDLKALAIKDHEVRALEANELKDDLSRWPASSFYFDQLPHTDAITRTNSSGKFSFDVQRNEPLVIVASSSRKIGDLTEHYYWMIRLVPKKPDENIILSNYNVGSSLSDESVLKTKKEQLGIDLADPRLHQK